MRLTPLGQALTDHKADFVLAVPALNQKLAERGDRSTDASYERAFERKDNAAVRLVRAFAEAMPDLQEHAPELAQEVSEKLNDIGFRFVVKPIPQNDDVTEQTSARAPSPRSGSDTAAQSLAAHL